MYSLPEIPKSATKAEKQTEIVNALIDAVDADIELLCSSNMVRVNGKPIFNIESTWDGFVKINMYGRRAVDYDIKDQKNFNAAVGAIKRKVAKIVEEIEFETKRKQIIAKRKAIMAATLGGLGLTYNQDDLNTTMATIFLLDTAIGPIRSSISHSVNEIYQYSATINLNYSKITLEQVTDLLKKVTILETK